MIAARRAFQKRDYGNGFNPFIATGVVFVLNCVTFALQPAKRFARYGFRDVVPVDEVATVGQPATDVAAAIEELRVAARATADASRAPATERAYGAARRDF